MTLRDVVLAVEAEAKAQPAVNMIVRNDVFRLNDCPDARYGVFAWTQQQHTAPAGGDFLRVTLNLYYVDRLNEDKSNELEVQSVGISTISDVLRKLEAAGVWLDGDAQFNTFNQRFVDECAGVWCNVRLQVPAGWICPDDFGIQN